MDEDSTSRVPPDVTRLHMATGSHQPRVGPLADQGADGRGVGARTADDHPGNRWQQVLSVA
jgi:hypothetical protein